MTHYIKASPVREIAKTLGYALYYDSSFEYDTELYSMIKQIYEVLFKGSHSAPFRRNIQMKCKINDNLVDALICCKEGKEVLAIRHEQIEHEKITLFDQQITLPKFSHTFTFVEPKIVNSDYESMKVGDLVDIELIPTADCNYIVEKLSDPRRN